jgi:pimeloyl-ACP methyl ester carboxylesterase
MFKKLLMLCNLLFAFCSVASGYDYDITLPNVPLNTLGIESNIHLKVFVNEEISYGKTVFAIPGWTHTVETWAPFADEVFKVSNDYGCFYDTKYLVAIDLPGHGKSTISPENAIAMLSFTDYTVAVISAIERLKADAGMNIKTVIGHSQGGLILQLVQKKLMPEGGLRKLGIRKAVLIAPVAPRELKWNFLDQFDPLYFAGNFLIQDKGYFLLPDQIWIPFFFTNAQTGAIASEAPTAEDVVSNGYNTPEPLYSSLELVGYNMQLLPDNNMRPSVSPGIFSLFSLVNMQMVCYTQDTLVTISECSELFKYLKKPYGIGHLTIINENDAIHDMHISNPDVVVEKIH